MEQPKLREWVDILKHALIFSQFCFKSGKAGNGVVARNFR